MIVNARAPSTTGIGVNHVNLSTNVKKPPTNTKARVSDPVLTEHPQGPRRCWCLGLLFVVGRRHLPSVLTFSDPAFEFCISRYQASIAFAGGAIADGAKGVKRRVTGVAGVSNVFNSLKLLGFGGVAHSSSFTCVGCYRPNRCCSSAYKSE